MAASNLIDSWKRGRASADVVGLSFVAQAPPSLKQRARRAYDWILEHAVYAPYFDIEFGTQTRLGTGGQRVWVGDGQAFSSFVLLPVLTLLTSQKLLLVGSPGRGKTTIATLMAMLAGTSLNEARRAVQRGHPQLTHSDLLGSPLPADLVKANSAADIRVHWRHWLKLRVKVIDEYNRIPTKTQSSLLSLMSEGCAEMYEQSVEIGRSCWFLTANDESGGGTFEVITALKDRIDAVVRTTPFDTEHLQHLAARVSSATLPEQQLPQDMSFHAGELDEAEAEIRAVPLPPEVLSSIGYLLGQLDFCRCASDRLEYMNKDTLMLAGKRLSQVCNEDCPLDKSEALCSQADGGVSARAYQSLILYAKALAWFRGAAAVSSEDVAQMLPWVLHDRLRPNTTSGFFQKPEHAHLLNDQVSWIRQLHQRGMTQSAAVATMLEPVVELEAEAAQLISGADVKALRALAKRLRQMMETLLGRHELNAPVHHALMLLKRRLTACQNRLHELETSR